MSNPSADGLEAFVEELQLPPVQPAPMAAAAGPPAPQTAGKSATVAGNSLLAFTAEVSPQHKDDLLNSFGLAQLAAVKQGANAAKDPIGYYQKVVDILTNIGYTGQSISFAEYNTKTRTVEIDKVVLEVMADLLTQPELAIVSAALKALQASSNENGAPWEIYHSSSSSDQNGGFSIGLANETNGSVAVKVSAFHFAGTESSTKFLWTSYSATSVHIKDGQTTLVLNDSVYSGVRGTVQEKMSSHARGYIANLPAL
jgi:hypothetical protein